APQAVKATFPAYGLGQTDHDGICWVNMPVGKPRAYTALPVTQGWSPPTTMIQQRAIPYLHQGVRFDVQRPDGDKHIIETATNTYISLGPDTSKGANATVRLMDSGAITFVSGGQTVATI